MRDDLTLQPKLATEVVPDGDAWLVRLRGDVRFSDGTSMDAQAVAAALRSLNADSPRASGSTGRIEVDVVDDLTVRITPERPVPVMAAVLAEFPIIMFKRDADAWRYTGPYVVAELDPGSRLRLEPNPHYWGEVPIVPLGVV